MSYDNYDLNLDYNKLERTGKKAGLREGISDGQEQNFQKSFDDGFREGFKNGYVISQFKASLFAKSSLHNIKLEKDELLKEPGKGWCDMCTNPEFPNNSLEETIETQNQIVNKNLETLKSKYKLSN